MPRYLIELAGQRREYDFRRVRRSRHIRVSVSASGRLLLTVPYYVSRKRGEQFILEKADWIAERSSQAACSGRMALGENREDYLDKKKMARTLVQERVKHFNCYYRFPLAKIRIANQKSRWGSCSAQKTVSYNYRIIYLPPALRDYVIVHELCHLKELNHSPRFWQLVAEMVPEWRQYRRELKEL